MSETDLNYFLEKSRVYGCEYNDYLSSHLPMALIALHRIGASKEQLSKFYSFYTNNLENLMPDEIKINSGNWNKFLGEHRYNSGYRDFFLSEIEAQGMNATISYYLPSLIPGLSGGAFHPLIRLAYAIEVNSEWEVAEALVSWCMAYQELGKIENSSKNPSVPLLDTLGKLAEVVKNRPIIIQGDNVFSYLKSVATTDTFSYFFNNLNLDKISLGEIADVVAKLYLSTRDSFTALHCVTATHALRVLESHLRGNEALKYLWQSVCATYVITKLVPIVEIHETKNLPSWEEIFEVARNQENDHVIKLAYTAHSEFLKYENPLYQLCAARKTGLRSWT